LRRSSVRFFTKEQALAALAVLENDAVPDRAAALRLGAALLAWSEDEASRYRCEEADAAPLSLADLDKDARA
jgi:hypothetical protein